MPAFRLCLLKNSSSELFVAIFVAGSGEASGNNSQIARISGMIPVRGELLNKARNGCFVGVLVRSQNARFRPPTNSFACHTGSAHKTGRHPLYHCRIRSNQAPALDSESLATPVAKSASLGSHCCRLVCYSHSPQPTGPFCSRLETLDSLEFASSTERAVVPPTVLAQVKKEARSKGTGRRGHRCGCRDEAT
jgi:hypothetical protein